MSNHKDKHPPHKKERWLPIIFDGFFFLGKYAFLLLVIFETSSVLWFALADRKSVNVRWDYKSTPYRHWSYDRYGNGTSFNVDNRTLEAYYSYEFKNLKYETISTIGFLRDFYLRHKGAPLERRHEARINRIWPMWSLLQVEYEADIFYLVAFAIMSALCLAGQYIGRKFYQKYL